MGFWRLRSWRQLSGECSSVRKLKMQERAKLKSVNNPGPGFLSNDALGLGDNYVVRYDYGVHRLPWVTGT